MLMIIFEAIVVFAITLIIVSVSGHNFSSGQLSTAFIMTLVVLAVNKYV